MEKQALQCNAAVHSSKSLKLLIWTLMALFALMSHSTSAAQSLDAGFPAQLDDLAAKYWQPSLKVAFGTFTYADTNLPTPFSRWLEEGLAVSITRCSRLQLFNRAAAAAMDPAFRSIYGDFFKSNSVDALLSGRYYDEGESVRTRLELTGLSDGVLIGTVDVRVPKAALSPDLEVGPTAAASATATSLGHLVSPGSEAGALKVSVSTERGPGAVYREGENMVVLLTVNKDAWVKVYHIDVNGTVQLIWPNRFDVGHELRAGETVHIPGSGDPFAFKMTAPFGTEFIKVIASTQPFVSNEEDFASLGADTRGVITRGLTVVETGATEQAEAMASYLIMGAK